MVKIILKHLRGTAYEAPVQTLLGEIKTRRMINNVRHNAEIGETDFDDEEHDIEDWNYRNFKDGWVPSWKALRAKLIHFYKDQKYHTKATRSGVRNIPAMVAAKEMVQEQLTALLAPGYGLRPAQHPEAKCWACGKIGHKRGDAKCIAGKHDVHHSAPERAKRNGKRKSYDGKKGRYGEPHTGEAKGYAPSSRTPASASLVQSVV